MYLTKYSKGDLKDVGGDEVLEQCDVLLITFKDAGDTVAVGACSRSGEIGLYMINEKCKDVKQFYTLIVVFCCQSFSWSGASRLYTGIDPDAHVKWARFLRLEETDTIPDHADAGLLTYEFKLSRWIQ